ncbi:MAG TPA: outer membrane beta-barrel protein [Acidobacteriaceae bacterium]|nr:outer membrane beta-barrel protein [Acidobacteriaceae bacterium]
MRRASRLHILFALLAFAAAPRHATAQGLSTASRRITPSVFAGLTGVNTGLDSGRNLSLTAGVDFDLLPEHTFHPAIEYRGTYALAKGDVDSLKTNLGGLKVSRPFRRFRPYADLLAGRGETTYANGGYQVPGKLIFYTQSSSNVFSLGGGTDVHATGHLALKIDLQLQHYSSPVTPSGHLYSETATVGLTYVFHTGRWPL